MNSVEHNLMAKASNLTIMATSRVEASSQPPKLGALASLKTHWPESLMKAALLGAFMVSACVFGALQSSKTPFVSSGVVANQNGQLGFSRAFVVRDPDGHAIEIEQK